MQYLHFLNNALHCLSSLAPFSAFIMTKYTSKYYTNDQNDNNYWWEPPTPNRRIFIIVMNAFVRSLLCIYLRINSRLVVVLTQSSNIFFTMPSYMFLPFLAHPLFIGWISRWWGICKNQKIITRVELSTHHMNDTQEKRYAEGDNSLTHVSHL